MFKLSRLEYTSFGSTFTERFGIYFADEKWKWREKEERKKNREDRNKMRFDETSIETCT